MTLSPGQMLLHYRIVEKLGQGGMGVVWKAVDTKLDREVAIKLLPEAFAGDSGRSRRFEQEAKTVAALKHPNIVTIHSLEEADSVQFLTMELVDGTTLADRLEEGGTPHPEELCNILLPLVDALGAAHAAGVVHRDLKPGNVMITPGGKVMLLDFGVAKLTASDLPDTEARTQVETLAGTQLGTPRYMAPEQLRGQPADARSDLFSLGVLIYELVTGRHPFEAGSGGEIISAILRDAPGPCTELEGSAIEELIGILDRCLEKDPDRRYQSAVELGESLRAFRASLSGSAGKDIVSRQAANDVEDLVRRGKDALREQKWTEAYECLSRAETQGSLGPHDVDALGEASFWVGEFAQSIRLREQAYAGFLDAGEPLRAGMIALSLADFHMAKRASAVARGWLKRAERLLSDPNSVEHGYLLRIQARLKIEGAGDLNEALAHAEETLEVARKFGDPNLEALGLLDKGRALIRMGRVEEGMSQVDEAMACSSSGQLSPEAAGRVYCVMMSCCELVGDIQRAGEWSAAAQSWCEPHTMSSFPGICRVHRAAVLRRSGKWEEAAEQARKAHEQLDGHVIDVAEDALYEIGEINLRRGNFEEAEEKFRQAHELGRDPMPGLALLRLAQGRTDAAQKLLRRALEETTVSLDRARLLPAWIEVSLAAGDRATAVEAASELAGIAEQCGSKMYEAAARHGRGMCHLAEGKAREAVQELRQAWRLWKELALPLEGGQTRLQLARAYRATGNDEDASLELQAALAAFQKLGAEPSVRMAESLIAGA